MSNDREFLLDTAIDAAILAGKEVSKHYQNGNFEQYTKDDESPLTSADLAANEILEDKLRTLTPDIPIMSEESGLLPLSERCKWQRYWLLDPIDGTGEFILGSGDFAVNVALIENNKPVIGVIHAPYHQITYFGEEGHGAFKSTVLGTESIEVAQYDGKRALNLGISRRQDVALIHKILAPEMEYKHIALGSCSLKNCLVAEGGADCYLRLGKTGEWDTGASQCILTLAGGKIVDFDFSLLSYNQRESVTNPDFIALGNPAIPWRDIIKKT